MITLLHGDCREVLTTLPDQSAQMIVTSPPYFGLRKYTDDDPREIGQEPTPAQYVAALVETFTQARRVLRDDGTLWINIGDSYASGEVGRNDGGRPEKDRGWAEYGYGQTKRETKVRDARFHAKNLLGIPWRVAFALQDDGWILRADIIWSKPNPMPESVKDRPTRAHEYVFLFSKKSKYFYDSAAIAEAFESTPTKKRQRGTEKSQYRAPGQPQQAGVYSESGSRNARTVWTIAPQPLRDEHYAPMPEALVERCIRAGSRAGDTVLDMFGGSGTTGRVSERLQRNAVLIELHAPYLEMQERRTDNIQVEMLV